MNQNHDDNTNTSSKPNVIDRFNLEYKFLSNFQASTIIVEGKRYPSVEHAYQSLKSVDLVEQEEIRNAVSAGQAKKMGKRVKPVDGWDDIKPGVMLDLLRLKFQNPFLRHKLIATGQIPLIEGNTWHDTFWGKCNCPKHNGEGLNVLGKLLMQVRDEVREEDRLELEQLAESK